MPERASAAPGLSRQERADGSVAYYWVAARAARGAKDYEPKTVRLIYDTDEERADRCRQLTEELLEWMEGQRRRGLAFDGTLATLIDCYQRDEDSPYASVKWNTRKHYDDVLKLLSHSFGRRSIETLTGRDFARWYKVLKEPAEEGTPERVRRAHNAIKLLRIVIRYGASMGFSGCASAAFVLSQQRFKNAPPRKVAMTYAQARAIVDAAIEAGRLSIALAQALQFECGLRQRDVIGEWAALSPGEISTQASGSAVPAGGIVAFGQRWTGGVLWSDLDDALVLRKTTTKTGADGEWDLTRCELVMAVLQHFEPIRGRIGPMIVDEPRGRPYFHRHYIRTWRDTADRAGVPRTVWNMDSRAGAITEGADAGAEIGPLRQFATHTDAKTTHGYTRSNRAASDRVAELRAARRSKGDG